MRKILLTLIVLLACKLTSFASHIVGGEFELLRLQDYEFSLNMIMYFDEKNGAAGAREESIIVYIYRKHDNAPMGSYILNKTIDQLVPYSNIECSDGQLITSRLYYSNIITLPPSQFDHPDGYYVAYERCCRNYTINNIESAIPGSGISAGQTFYLEFPPVVKDGVPFINSTPRLFPPLRDYGCVDKFYFADFGGIDDDGDSLVYTMVTPYSTIDTQLPYPVTPNSGPYPEVIWKQGFGLENIVNGSPDLKISEAGLLTVTPKFEGLFVFAVKCEEFRNGEKIGEMRRDFQMLVVSNCANESPVVRAREKGKSGFYVEGNELYFPYVADERCVEILVNDVPVSGDFSEDVTIRAIPINFNAQLEGIEITETLNAPLQSVIDTARFEVCFPQCPYVIGKPYKIGIIALDDACPQPALDTVIVTLNIQPPPNTRAFFAETVNSQKINNITKNVTSVANGNLTFDINGFDLEDEVLLDITPLGFNLADVGMTFTEPLYGSNDVSTTFNWKYDCNTEDLNFSQGRDVPVSSGVRKAFDILLRIDDVDQCTYEDPKEIIMTLNIDFPDQTKPKVFEVSKPGASYQLLKYKYGQVVDLNIKAQDNDNDLISLFGIPRNFNFEDIGMTFENKVGAGNPGITSNLFWSIPCQYDGELDSLRVSFFVEDLDDCQLTNTDTLDIDILLSPPINSAPEVFMTSLNDVEIINDSISVIVGEAIEVNIRALDLEGDVVVLDLLDRNEDAPFVFEAAEGAGAVQSLFSWTPTCADLTGPGLTRDLELTFLVQDQNCYESRSTLRTLKIHVQDLESGGEQLMPPNFFTPNGDEYNAFFGMFKRDENTNELRNILPIDNCAGQFEEVVIFNRWGRQIFQSDDREFKWFGENASAGVYYYQIRYTNQKYQGSVTVMY
jgi:hypothetical protein